jgi:hypothetical protein
LGINILKIDIILMFFFSMILIIFINITRYIIYTNKWMW